MPARNPSVAAAGKTAAMARETGRVRCVDSSSHTPGPGGANSLLSCMAADDSARTYTALTALHRAAAQHQVEQDGQGDRGDDAEETTGGSETDGHARADCGSHASAPRRTLTRNSFRARAILTISTRSPTT